MPRLDDELEKEILFKYLTNFFVFFANKQVVRKMDVKGQQPWQKRMFKIADSGEVQLFLGVLLMLSLFINESWVLGNAPDSSNEALYSVLTFVFICFCAETVVLSFVQPHYFLGFFFWMDCLGTVSIILDIGWIADSVLKGGGGSNSGSILRATRAAKLGARYGRLMRVLKLIKFMKFLPCFKEQEDEKPEPTLTAVRRVSNQLTNILSQRVAGLVMLLVILLPFLSYEDMSDQSVDAWVNTLKIAAKGNIMTQANFLKTIDKFYKFYRSKDQKLQYLIVTSPHPNMEYSKEFVSSADLREDNLVEYSTSFIDSGTTYYVTATMDRTIPNQADAMFGIVIIILVIFLLVFFSASFQNAVESTVVVPLEKVMIALRTSAGLMLKSVKAMEDPEDAEDDDEDGELETQALERMVEKLVKIVSSVSNTEITEITDKNVDAATANWLKDTYGDNGRKASIIIGNDDDEMKQKRLASLDSAVLPCSLEKFNSFDFDVLDYNQGQLEDAASYLMDVLNVFDEFKVPQDVFKAFCSEIAGRYKDNTYHNFYHGYDVMHTVYRLVTIPSLHHVFSHLEFFALLMAALSHDVGHPGVNNVYLVKAKNELALAHNDRSPLENMHCAVIYEVLTKPKTNIFVGLTESQWREARKLILTTVLGTDMSHHFEQISKSNVFFEVNGEDTAKFCSGESDNIECLAEEKERLFLMEICLHCADISNPYKPFKICSRWADLVVEEFARQGEREHSEGLEISPMMDRATIQLCNMQMGFIEFVVAPLIMAVVKILPPLAEIGQNMSDNYCCWGEKRKLEIKVDGNIENKDEEITKLDSRMNGFKEKLAFCKDLRAKPTRRDSSTLSSEVVKK